MGIKTTRQKPRQPMIAVVYWLQKLLPMGAKSKIKLFMNLEWIFDRLSHETSFSIYSPEDHPFRKFSKKFILENINSASTVLDLGCNLGDISYMIAQKAKQVVGIDYNETAIEAAKTKYKHPNLQFYHREAYDYLLENPRQFDTLILSHILEHLDNPEDFLQKFKGFFKEIYIELPDFDRTYLNQYRKDAGVSLIYTDDDHISEFDRDELMELLQKCHIEVFKSEYRFGIQKLWCRVN
ncbi:MAG: class I SAM-dependent methyltransferase [Ferruginibacter sp.]